ncbi:uncharacterized protein LOC115089974 isoform X2 [Rhinatrema bivittatum]|uniref:uncharacterized protein LOC115089974 isoform X2 n=1 Tax=Rhinatrema bivittatum TaxID=194408 RepID=UPI001128F39D|nr:uncharacterized protein LOC115089974 isoform X2 [Rhinatrema bivittatum]XP_029454332.1 uncharacterized protein LOC115089974 isoform X2 [Rhinatrema bivittatum]
MEIRLTKNMANKSTLETITPASQTQAQKTKQLQQPPLLSSSLDHCYDMPPISESEMLDAARKEITRLQQRIEVLEGKLFFLERFSNDSSIIHFYTGFKDYATLKAMFSSLKPTTVNMMMWRQCQEDGYNGVQQNEDAGEESLALIDQFFLFLCKIRQGFLEQDLAVRFNVSQSTVVRIIITWANYLHFMLAPLLQWPSREEIDKDMPACFQVTYPSTRLILDCIEIKVQTESRNVPNSGTYFYSSYTTFKGLIGISPSGTVIFLSPLFSGCISDNEIVQLSGILNLLDVNDVVIADKDFPIQDLLASVGAHLVATPFYPIKTVEELTYTMEGIQSVLEDQVPVAVEEVAIVMEEVPVAVEEVAVVMQEVLVAEEMDPVVMEEFPEAEEQDQVTIGGVPLTEEEDPVAVETVPTAGEKVSLSEEQHPAIVEEVLETNETASVRICVRFAIGKVRAYHIFDKVIPRTLASTTDQLWAVCAILSNYNDSLS